MKLQLAPWLRIIVAPSIAATAVLFIGYAWEWSDYGLSPDTTFERIKKQTENNFNELRGFLSLSSEQLATSPELAVQLATESTRASRTKLFNLTRGLQATRFPDVATTVYDGTATARAWTGKPTELTLTRILGDASTFIIQTPMGLRLVVLRPVSFAQPGNSDNQHDARRVGSVSSEYLLTTETDIYPTTEIGLFSNTLVNLAFLQSNDALAVDERRSFPLTASDGTHLLTVTITEDDLILARNTWRQSVHRSALAIFGTLLLLLTAAPLLRHPTRVGTPFRTSTSPTTVIWLIAAVAVLWISDSSAVQLNQLPNLPALQSQLAPTILRTPVDILLLSLTLIVIGSVFVRLSGSTSHSWQQRNNASRLSRAVAGHLLAGITSLALVVVYDQLLKDVVGNSSLDVAYPSLNPWDTSRISLILGLLLLATASQWIAASTLSLASSRWKASNYSHVSMVVCWLIPLFAHAIYAGLHDIPFILMSIGPLFLSLNQSSIRLHYRQASQSARLIILFGVLVLPSIVAYPRIVSTSTEAKIHFIEKSFSPATADHPQNLLESLSVAQTDIDAELALLPWQDSITPNAEDPEDSNLAFTLWQETELARLRLTSAIELYGPENQLVSRFALNFPEYTPLAQPMDHENCEWEVYGEVSPFGSQEHRLLHAQRGICQNSAQEISRGTIVVHLPLDYRSLPFGNTPSPYYDEMQPDRAYSGPGKIGANIDVAVYGWGLTPLFTTNPGTWSITEELFEQIYETRNPFWTQLSTNGVESNVYFSNNRYGIYALGFPSLTIYDHLVRIAEIVALLGIAYLLWVFLSTTAGQLSGRRNLFGYGLIREVRTSFYRRLLFAFVIGAVIPILLLAFLVRNYSIAQLQGDAEILATRTALIAQRVVTELRANAANDSSEINDDLLVFVSQMIDQDVNVFEGSRLLATSERDLFASGILPTRTPDEVYEAIVLSQLPSFVTTGSIGEGEYLVAAAPLLPGTRDSVLTVPMASRQYEIDQQIDEFDRGLLLAVMLLILLGALSSYYIADRIANPVQQLTKATKRIIQGKYDEPIVTRTDDELEQLVLAFNQMANELTRQRRELAHTNRLKAWAEMARQVAHEIKNPLTPVQLSAEHLLRVHTDKGKPLGPVLDDCVSSILKQVTNLRQISSNFSNYGTSPDTHKRETIVGEMISSLVDPYRRGLSDRIDIQITFPNVPIRAYVDPTLVGRALTNIIENALHAMPVTGTLAIGVHRNGEHVIITIRDTGIGFDQETQRRIFEPYFSTKVTGTGLGMAIAKRNIELNDGSISVQSTPGSGTTVTVTFLSGIKD